MATSLMRLGELKVADLRRELEKCELDNTRTKSALKNDYGTY